MIAIQKLWLFKADILDPFVFTAVNGVNARMSDERTIENLTIDEAGFYFDSTVNAVLNWSTMYGGEDGGATTSTGKSEHSYELEFDFPNFSPELIEELVGNEWAMFGETIGREKIAIFARLEAKGYDFENDQKGRMVLKSGRRSGSRVYKVLSYAVGEVVNVIDREAICGFVEKDNNIKIWQN